MNENQRKETIMPTETESASNITEMNRHCCRTAVYGKVFSLRDAVQRTLTLLGNGEDAGALDALRFMRGYVASAVRHLEMAEDYRLTANYERDEEEKMRLTLSAPDRFETD